MHTNIINYAMQPQFLRRSRFRSRLLHLGNRGEHTFVRSPTVRTLALAEKQFGSIATKNTIGSLPRMYGGTGIDFGYRHSVQQPGASVISSSTTTTPLTKRTMTRIDRQHQIGFIYRLY